MNRVEIFFFVLTVAGVVFAIRDGLVSRFVAYVEGVFNSVFHHSAVVATHATTGVVSVASEVVGAPVTASVEHKTDAPATVAPWEPTHSIDELTSKTQGKEEADESRRIGAAAALNFAKRGVPVSDEIKKFNADAAITSPENERAYRAYYGI